jgi:uncharacterized protein involved in exopolysaccharide biosynthesis/Mrp family chromosome partitioning ATPase
VTEIADDEATRAQIEPEVPPAAGVGKSSLVPDPRFLVDILRRRFWIFLGVLALISAATIAYAVFAPRYYTAVATVMIEPAVGDPVRAEGAQPAEQQPSDDRIDTQILVLDSPELARRVVQSLKLIADPQYGGSPDADQESPRVQGRRLEAIAQTLRALTTIRRAGSTSLIEIVVTTRDPRESARIANAFASEYLNGISADRTAQQVRSNAQVDSRLTQLQQDAQQADAALQRYKIANGLMSAEGATMAEQETSTLNQQIAAARATLAEKQGRLNAARRQLRAGGGGSDVASALNSGTISSLRAQEADSSRNLAQLRSRYGPKHPAVAQEEQKLADVQRQIQLEIDRIISSLEAEVNVASSGLSSLLQSQAASRGRLAGNAAAQVGYLELQRKADAARTIYEAFLNRSRGAQAREGIDSPIATLSSAAQPPARPASPNLTLVYLVGGLFGLIAALVAVAVAEFLDDRVSTKQDVERRLGARFLGAIPELESTLDGMRNSERPEDYIVSHPLSSFAEALRSLNATVTLRGHRRPKTIVVASALPLEGKTTTAICLARTLAMSGARTAFIDCDLRRRSASQALLGQRPGRLLEVLDGKLGHGEAMVVDEPTGLHVLGASDAPGDGRDWLAPTLIGPLLERLREEFEFIIIDTAPVLGVADARTVAQQADAVVLLARWRETSLRAADTALDLLVASRADVAGVAMTLVDVTRYGSGGGEHIYGYHKKFKGYYVN